MVQQVAYEVKCLNSQWGRVAKYIGTSGFSNHKRVREHQQDVRNRRQQNSLYKHHALHHANREARFASRSVRKGINFTMYRYNTEALLIEESNQDPNLDILNNRSESGQRGVPRVQFNV